MAIRLLPVSRQVIGPAQTQVAADVFSDDRDGIRLAGTVQASVENLESSSINFLGHPSWSKLHNLCSNRAASGRSRQVHKARPPLMAAVSLALVANE